MEGKSKQQLLGRLFGHFRASQLSIPLLKETKAEEKGRNEFYKKRYENDLNSLNDLSNCYHLIWGQLGNYLAEDSALTFSSDTNDEMHYYYGSETAIRKRVSGTSLILTKRNVKIY